MFQQWFSHPACNYALCMMLQSFHVKLLIKGYASLFFLINDFTEKRFLIQKCWGCAHYFHGNYSVWHANGIWTGNVIFKNSTLMGTMLFATYSRQIKNQFHRRKINWTIERQLDNIDIKIWRTTFGRHRCFRYQFWRLKPSNLEKQTWIQKRFVLLKMVITYHFFQGRIRERKINKIYKNI